MYGEDGFDPALSPFLDDLFSDLFMGAEFGNKDDLNCDDAFNSPPVSPLVIDLDGDGIELTSLDESPTFFDLNVDGFAEHTGWVAPDDGLLAMDANGNGNIDDNSELFGNATGYSNGFAQLEQLDSNSDGVIDENDDQFANLLIWRDLDQDGKSDDGELQSLSDVGITSIDLNATEVDETNQEHLVSHSSNVTFSDGSTGLVEDIHFQNNTGISVAVLPENFEYNAEALAMPVLWGYGQISSTWVALSLDDDLRSEAADLMGLLSAGDIASFKSQFESFLFNWADVADVDPSSRGSHIDARKLAFLEKAYGTGYVDQYGGSDPRVNAGREIGESFDQLLEKLAGRFMAQSATASAFFSMSSLDDFYTEFSSHPLSALAILTTNYSPTSPALSGDLSKVLSGLQNSIGNGTITASSAIAAVELLQEDMSASKEEFTLLLQVAAVKAGLDPSTEFLTSLTSLEGQQLLDGTTGNDTITANGASYIKADAGDDIVAGSSESDLIFGGEGNDTLNGGAGGDIYAYSLGDGSDTIRDYSTKGSENDRLVFTDVNADDVTFSQNSGKDLIITLSNGDTITITDHFDNGWEDMELIEFADGTVLDLAGIAAKTISDQNGDGNDVVRGSNDADTFHGGVGNDTLIGGTGADTYIYSLGDGSDTIKDYSTRSEDDRLVFTDVNADDVTFSQNSGKDLIITLSNGDTITITDHFDNGWEDMELIEFADGTVLDLAGIAAKAISDQNGDGDDVVRGSTGSDTFHGGVGNDTLIGGTGADTYIYSLGDGSDTIKDYSTRSEDDRLVFTDVNVDDVVFSQNSGEDLVITLSNGDTVTVTDHFDNTREQMEQIEFADGTVLDLAGIAAKSLLGGSGDDTIVGFSTDDLISGGAGDDVLTGGAGADEFVFDTQTASGADRITDFELNSDQIHLSGGSYADLTFVDTGSGTRIEWDNGSVELDGIAVASLTEDQFSFV